jgi:hypothetical protein
MQCLIKVPCAGVDNAVAEDDSPALRSRRCAPAVTPPSPVAPKRVLRPRLCRADKVHEHVERLAQGKRPKGFTPSPRKGAREGVNTPGHRQTKSSHNPLFDETEDDDFMPSGSRAYSVGYDSAPRSLSGGNLLAHYRKHVLRVPSQNSPGEGSEKLPDSPDAKVESPYKTDSDDQRQLTQEEQAAAKRAAKKALAEADLKRRQAWRPGEPPPLFPCMSRQH